MSAGTVVLDRICDEQPDLAEQYASVHRAVNGAMPTAEQLFACCDRGTYEGVLESALHLDEPTFARLTERVKQARRYAETHRPRTRRRSS